MDIRLPLGNHWLMSARLARMIFTASVIRNDIAVLCLENLDAIELWRASLSDAQRRRHNHPNSVWFSWKRATKPATPARQYVRGAKSSHRPGKPIY